jgi:hypothetical protein
MHRAMTYPNYQMAKHIVLTLTETGYRRVNGGTVRENRARWLKGIGDALLW